MLVASSTSETAKAESNSTMNFRFVKDATTREKTIPSGKPSRAANSIFATHPFPRIDHVVTFLSTISGKPAILLSALCLHDFSSEKYSIPHNLIMLFHWIDAKRYDSETGACFDIILSGNAGTAAGCLRYVAAATPALLPIMRK